MVNFQRQEQLIANNFTPKATFDVARNTLQGSQQKLASLQQQLAGLAANMNGDPDAPIENHPKYKDAVAARDEAARQLAHTIVRAPFAGIVTNVPSLQPGQYLAAAATAFNIVSTDHVWVQASPKETELTYVKPGQKVTVEVDTFPGQRWAGTVESISPASASSFSLLPAENTSGNWVKVVQRIPMRGSVNHDPAIGLSCKQVRPQTCPDGGRRRLRDCIRALRHCAIAGRDRGFPIAAGILRRSAGSAGPVRSARCLHGGRTRVRHGPVRRIGDGGASAGAGDRRLADRPLQLAMGILYQRALGSTRIRWHIVLSEGDENQRGSEA